MELKIEYLNDYPEYVEEVTDLCFNEWSFLYPEITREKWLEAVKERSLTQEIPFTLIALDDNTLVGTASLFENDMEYRLELKPWLAALIVKEGFRKRGIGEALVDAITAQCRERGFERYYLFTPDMEKFYAKRGWSVIEQRDYRNEEVTIMKKELQ